MTEQRPSVGRIVHYVSPDGTGSEPGECRAAIITELTGDPDRPEQVGLTVFNLTGQSVHRYVPHDDGSGREGAPDCLDRTAHGDPFRYCACGWVESAFTGGTWHWPERVG